MSEQKAPLVSIIIPCYNQENFLLETLISVRNQTYIHWECIIVNDGSTDKSQQIAKEFCKKNNNFFLLSQSNKGLSSARNAGIKASKGKYLQFLDSDDILLPNKIELQVTNILKNQSDISIVHYQLFEGSQRNRINNDRNLTHYDCTTSGILYQWNKTFVFPPICYLVSHEFLQNNNIFFNENLTAIEDWAFLSEMIIQKAKFSVLDDILALYRRHSNNMSSDFPKMSHNLIKASLYIYSILPLDEKHRYFDLRTKYLTDYFLKNSKTNKGNIHYLNLLNSIDYKLGKTILSPFHRISSYVKRLYKKTNI